MSPKLTKKQLRVIAQRDFQREQTNVLAVVDPCREIEELPEGLETGHVKRRKRTSVFRLIDANLKPCHQNGIELRRRPSASTARSAPTRRWTRRAGTCHQHHKAVPMTDSSHSTDEVIVDAGD